MLEPRKSTWNTGSVFSLEIILTRRGNGGLLFQPTKRISTPVPKWRATCTLSHQVLFLLRYHFEVLFCAGVLSLWLTSTFLSCNSSLKTLLLERASVRSNETNQEKPIGAVKGKQWVYISSIPFIHNICAHINCFSNWADPFDINPWIFPL